MAEHDPPLNGAWVALDGWSGDLDLGDISPFFLDSSRGRFGGLLVDDSYQITKAKMNRAIKTSKSNLTYTPLTPKPERCDVR